jgi:hypothetical protein
MRVTVFLLKNDNMIFHFSINCARIEKDITCINKYESDRQGTFIKLFYKN